MSNLKRRRSLTLSVRRFEVAVKDEFKKRIANYRIENYTWRMADASLLLQKHCVPCEGGVDPIKGEKLQYYLPAVPDWTVPQEMKIERDFSFKDFKEAMTFVNKVADLAEEEQHHPDIYLHNWRKVKITLMTHKIKGLFDNDFIMAVKIDSIFSRM